MENKVQTFFFRVHWLSETYMSTIVDLKSIKLQALLLFLCLKTYTLENYHFESKHGGLEDDFPFQLGAF